MTREELIEMIEAGGCAGLDVAIMEALGLEYNGEVLDSLDAAVALVERVRPGAPKTLVWLKHGVQAHFEDEMADAPTPAAALVAALLKAMGGE